MDFLLIVVISLVVLGTVAALLSLGGKDEPIVQKEGDCSSCSSRSECKLVELKEKGDRRRQTETAGDRGQMTCGHHESAQKLLSSIYLFLLLTPFVFLSCSTKKNTMQSRFWQSFTARYNTYYNGSQAFIDGCIEKENGNRTTILN